MKANELRIGNFISYRDEKILKVSSIGDCGLRTCNVNGITSGSDCIDDYQPIPLTPEILVLNSFGEDNNGHFLLDLQTDYLEIIPMKDGFYPMYGQKRETSGDSDNLVTLNRIDSVHQLQNLYFALTGEELNIDL